ncbi:MAG: hypothetical protein B7Z68_11785, partial [Acidobacteria bacterium 21-70-11]
MPRRALAALLVVGQLTLTLSGCMSVEATGTRPLQGPGGGVSVQVFPDDSARRAGRPGPDGILGEVDRQSGRGWVPVFRSLNPAWTVAGLPPGEYRVRFPARLDASGNVVRLSDKSTTVAVREGAVTDVRAVLDHVSTGLVVLGVVTVVAIAVILTKESRDHGLPLPPPPPPELLDAVFYVSINLAASSGWENPERSLPPAVTSHFPAAGAVVAARRPRLVFSLTEPLRPTSLNADGVTVLGEASGLVPGQVSYDAENWWVVWQPAVDLAPGDTFHVTLAKDAVEDLAGHEALIAAGLRAIRYDQRGHGRSASPPSGYRWGDHAADLAEVIVRVAGGPAHVVGLSKGGGIALELAVRRPELVRTLALIGPLVPDAPLSDELLASFKVLARAIRSEGPRAVMGELWLSHPLIASAAARPGARERLEAMLQTFPAGEYLATVRDAPDRTWKLTERLAEIAVPTLVVRGAREIPDFVSSTEILANAVAGAQVVVIPESGHLVPLEQ